MSDIEFFAKLNPKPFKSLAIIEKDRVEELKREKELALLKAAGKIPAEPEPPETREPFYD
ncbi:hypothetical protein C2759_04705 [Polynucleobacter sp. MG-Unter2-18]|uniref:hypothetical protein n=1 Tax=Polynucleobacter sp. MG-Unter2-18 TaxID=2081052 RepID=UPI001BFED509|nr:hypothetical protein [Polynucleobacter sp. MG-Unter2-18]QWD95422.1 hypothetical protein C2759_04705 [Polynucleobacter sp. MG-Unter2-18]